MDAKILSIIWIAALAIIVVADKRNLLSLTSGSTFFWTHIVLVLVGTLASPWLVDFYLPLSFASLHIEYITDSDVKRAINVVAGGVLLVWAGYRATSLILFSSKAPPPRSLLASNYPILGGGFTIRPALILFAFCALAVAVVLLSEIRAIASAISAGFEGETYYAARAALDKHGRLFAYLATSALPFIATCAAGLAWHTHRFRLATLSTVVVSFLILLLTFKKIFLVNQVLCLVATWYVVHGEKGRWGLVRAGAHFAALKLPQRRSLWPLVWMLLGAFVFVAGSYYVVAAGGLSPLLAAGIAIERLFSRLTVMLLIYAHYFPTVADHYGISNVQMFAALSGSRLYEDTVVTVEYFNRFKSMDGSGACGAIMDFYGAFGWYGWAALCPALGAALQALDRMLDGLRPVVLNKVFHVYTLLTVTFLAQASIFRTLSTYGGGVIIATWLTMTLLYGRYHGMPRLKSSESRLRRI